MLRTPLTQSGDRISAEFINEIVRRVRATMTASGGDTGTVFHTAAGTAITSNPLRRTAAFLIGTTRWGTLIGKEAFQVPADATWRVASGGAEARRIVGRPYPGYSVQDYQQFVLEDPDVVTATDRAVEYEEGVFLFPRRGILYMLVRVHLDVDTGAMNVYECATNGDLIGEPLENAHPWPGQTINDYRYKRNVTMVAFKFGDEWRVLMTGDRPYVPFPDDFCEACGGTGGD